MVVYACIIMCSYTPLYAFMGTFYILSCINSAFSTNLWRFFKDIYTYITTYIRGDIGTFKGVYECHGNIRQSARTLVFTGGLRGFGYSTTDLFTIHHYHSTTTIALFNTIFLIFISLYCLFFLLLL